MDKPGNQGQPESKEPTTQTAGEPAAPQAPDPNPTPAPAAPAPDEPTTHSPKVADVDGYLAKRKAALQPQEPKAQDEPGEPADPAPADPAAPADPQSPPQAAPPADPAQPPADPVDPAAPAAKSEFRPRLGNLPEDEKEAIALRKTLKDQGKDVPLDECLKRVRAKYDVQEPANPQAPDPNAPPARTVEQIDSEIAEREAASDQAAKDLDVEAVNRLNREIRALEKERSKVELAQVGQQQEALTKFEQEVAANERRVVTMYPAANDEAHPIHAEAERIFALLEKTGNPKAKEADATIWVYQQAANNLGILPVDPDAPAAPAQPKPSTSATPKPQPVVQTAVPGRPAQPSLAPGSARTTAPGQPAPHLVKASTRHGYEEKLAKLGLRAA